MNPEKNARSKDENQPENSTHACVAGSGNRTRITLVGPPSLFHQKRKVAKKRVSAEEWIFLSPPPPLTPLLASLPLSRTPFCLSLSLFASLNQKWRSSVMGYCTALALSKCAHPPKQAYTPALHGTNHSSSSQPRTHGYSSLFNKGEWL